MKWLLSLAEEYRAEIRSGQFFKALEMTERREQVKVWMRQLYYQSRDFTSALSMRYAVCKDPRFQGCFAKHAMEEVDHCDQLLAWMRKHDFLDSEENPTAILPTLETSLVSAYCFRSIFRESYAHQVIAMNLISEGVSYDFFSAVNPKLKSLGLSVGRYWQVHQEIDQQHLQLGLDLIPQCEKDSAQGKVYAQIAWETASLYQRMLDSWSQLIPANEWYQQQEQVKLMSLT